MTRGPRDARGGLDEERARREPRTVLVVSQVYVPDPASVGQHMADAAAELAARGHRVVVLTSDRGYDDPAARYARRETIDGVEVRRLPFSSFGKGSIGTRLLGGILFTLQAIAASFGVRGVRTVLVSTSPPMASLAAIVIGWLRRASVKYWIMDLNPDQMVALGKLSPTALPVRAFDALNRAILRRADDVVVLDRFMAARVNAKLDVRDRMTVLPPWPHEDHVDAVAHDENPFRRRHGLEGKFVVMYSGNHGPSNPLSTLLAAAERVADEPDLVFMFIGGGVGKAEVESAAARLPNVRSLPYQPLAELRYSLSAADVHVVSVGDDIVGIVHPCKVYGAMAVARPILLLGPAECHVADLMMGDDLGWRVPHGDVDAAERLLRGLVRERRAAVPEHGRRALAVLEGRLTKRVLCGALCDVVERDAAHERASARRELARA